MKPSWLFFSLLGVLIGSAICKVTQLNSVVFPTLSNDLIRFSMEDEHFIYYLSAGSEHYLSKINKSELATESSPLEVPRSLIAVATESSFAGVLADGYIFLCFRSVIYRIPTNNFHFDQIIYYYLDVSKPVHARTGFVSKDSDGIVYANFPSYSAQTPVLLQIRSDLTEPRFLPMPDYFDVQSSVYNGNTKNSFLITYDGKISEMNTESGALPLNFTVSSLFVRDSALDSENNFLYLCGDYLAIEGAYLVRVNLTAVNNDDTLTVPRDPTDHTVLTNSIAAVYLGSECATVALDTANDRAIVTVHNGTSSARILSVHLPSMDVAEEAPIVTSNQKIVDTHLDSSNGLIFLTLQQGAAAFLISDSQAPLHASPVDSTESPLASPLSTSQAPTVSETPLTMANTNEQTTQASTASESIFTSVIALVVCWVIVINVNQWHV